MGFAKTYCVWSNKIGNALDGLIEEYSDDSWSDFCDAIPLVGEDFAKKALLRKNGKKRDGYLDENEVMDCIMKSVSKWVYSHLKDNETSEQRQNKVSKWFQLICDGENYCHTALEDGVKNFYKYTLIDTMDQKEI